MITVESEAVRPIAESLLRARWTEYDAITNVLRPAKREIQTLAMGEHFYSWLLKLWARARILPSYYV